MTIGTKIKVLRALKGLTQDELCKKTNIVVSAMSHIENGKAKPQIGTLKKIADALDVPLEELVNI